ncbi:CidA/LrgA family protein [Thiolapillus sp.]
MKFLNGLTLLLIYQLAGEIGVRAFQWPVPGPVLGMLLLFLTLLLRKGRVSSVDVASTALLSHLSLLFVPAGVGMMVHFNYLADEWLPIVVALVLGTVVTMMISAAIMQGASQLFSSGVRDDD